MEDRYGVSRSGAYVKNVRLRLDPRKEILAGMRVLSYHGMYGTAYNGGIAQEGNNITEKVRIVR